MSIHSSLTSTSKLFVPSSTPQTGVVPEFSFTTLNVIFISTIAFLLLTLLAILLCYLRYRVAANLLRKRTFLLSPASTCPPPTNGTDVLNQKSRSNLGSSDNSSLSFEINPSVVAIGQHSTLPEKAGNK